MILSYPLLFFVLAASVAAVPLPGGLLKSSEVPPSQPPSPEVPPSQPPSPEVSTSQHPQSQSSKESPLEVPQPPEPLANASWIVGNYMRGSLPKGLEHTKAPQGPDVPHLDDHIMFEEITKELHITMERANGKHVLEDAGYRKKVSDLNPAVRLLLPGMWIRMTAEEHQATPKIHPAKNKPHDAIWVNITSDGNQFLVQKLTKAQREGAANHVAEIYGLKPGDINPDAAAA